MFTYLKEASMMFWKLANSFVSDLHVDIAHIQLRRCKRLCLYSRKCPGVQLISWMELTSINALQSVWCGGAHSREPQTYFLISIVAGKLEKNGSIEGISSTHFKQSSVCVLFLCLASNQSYLWEVQLSMSYFSSTGSEPKPGKRILSAIADENLEFRV